jgi:CRISPR system Cascade subunit CasA
MARGTVETHFNLATDPWMLVIYQNGACREVSIETSFRDAKKIREISGDSPQQVEPILRLLLAILYRQLLLRGIKTEDALLDWWEETWENGHFDLDGIISYLTSVKDRFDLFDSSHPFYQVADLGYSGKAPDGVDELVADVPKSDKFLFSLRSKNRIDGLSFAEASRWLIFQQAYATAGIKTPVKGNTHVKSGKVYPPKGAVGTGMLGAEGGMFLEGVNLFQTLMLNLVLFDNVRKGKPIIGCKEDVPSWEQDGTTPDYRIPNPGEPFGPVQCYTWQSRRMRLVPNNEGDRAIGVISCYGDIPVVMDKEGSEPMTAWRPSPTQQKSLGLSYVPRLPKAHDPSRAIWRGLASIVSVGQDGDLRPGVVRWIERLRYEEVLSSEEFPVVAIHAQGMAYGTQNSVFADAVDDKFDLSVSLFEHDSRACNRALATIDSIDQAVGKVVNFVSNTQRAAGDKASTAVATQERSRVRESVFAELDSLCRMRLAHFPNEVDAVEAYCVKWREEVRRRLLTYAARYLNSCDRSFFGEHDGMSVGRAMAILRAGLSETLGKPEKSNQSTEGTADATAEEGRE